MYTIEHLQLNQLCLLQLMIVTMEQVQGQPEDIRGRDIRGQDRDIRGHDLEVHQVHVVC